MNSHVIERFEDVASKTHNFIEKSKISVDQNWFSWKLTIQDLMKNGFMANVKDNILTLIFRVKTGNGLNRKFASITHFMELPCELDQSSLTTVQENNELFITMRRNDKKQSIQGKKKYLYSKAS